MRILLLTTAVLLAPLTLWAESWTIVLPEDLRQDAAIQLAIEDVIETGKSLGIAYTTSHAAALPAGNVLLVDWAMKLAEEKISVAPVDDDQGYVISTIRDGDRRIMAVLGGSTIGDAYGLYWIWDRMRVYKHMPDINTVRTPALRVRVGAAWGRSGFGGSSPEEMRMALRQSTNWVSGPAVLDLVPWDAEPEATRNAENRAKARELIDYAHQLHMNYFSFANEFTYHPSLIAAHGATLSPDDPKFWDAVQDKFRMLFEVLPELDGVELCNDDISGFWDNYLAYDVLHENPEVEWSYPKRFRTFVNKVQEVVAGEFGKTYLHFTWGLSAHEQHVQPAVFRDIFTDAVPTQGLYLIPKITTGDRWWHQPYNSTFNLTPHDTIVCFETMNYYEGGSSHLFPTFSGQYFQAGLQTLLLPERCNLKGGASIAGSRRDGWGTAEAYSYVLYRLFWNPNEDMQQIARDFCAIHFGPEAADAMAGIYLDTAAAYKYGLHIEPISYGQYNSFIHMRVGTFPAEGYPSIDQGREHLEFLRKIYLRCKPWIPETLDDLDHGLDLAQGMIAKFQAAKPLFTDTALAQEIAQRLDMTRLLIAMNNNYARTIFAYFDYMDAASGTRHAALTAATENLIAARENFTQAPGFKYQLFGIDTLLRNAQAAVADVAEAKETLAKAPTRSQIDATVADQQRRYTEVLEKHAEKAVHFAHFDAHIDGRDIFNVSGGDYTIEHLRWDGPEVREATILVPLPNAPVTVVPKDIYSRPMHPFVLEQPSGANGYTVRIYLDDLPGGKDAFVFDLYYIPLLPEELGLEIPWNANHSR